MYYWQHNTKHVGLSSSGTGVPTLSWDTPRLFQVLVMFMSPALKAGAHICDKAVWGTMRAMMSTALDQSKRNQQK